MGLPVHAEPVHHGQEHAPNVAEVVPQRGQADPSGLPEAPITPQVTPVPDGFDVDNSMLVFRLPNRVWLDLGPKLLNYLWGVPMGPEETRIFILS